MDNQKLQKKYDEMHAEGKSAWFDDGTEERRAIFEMGKPWTGLRVLEIGCGEGDLLDMISGAGAVVSGIDYSDNAIMKAREKYIYLDTVSCHWQDWPKSRNQYFDVILMQGVLEHLDDPWESLDGIIAKFQPKTVITSMPCFLNPRGIVWMTLDMLGAVMSKTDLHFIHPWDVQRFCQHCGHKLIFSSIDKGWAYGAKMIEDLRQRIPLALKDGFLDMKADKEDVKKFIEWLENAVNWSDLGGIGAVAIYRIDI